MSEEGRKEERKEGRKKGRNEGAFDGLRLGGNRNNDRFRGDSDCQLLQENTRQ